MSHRPANGLSRPIVGPTQPANLADLLERVLDKGIVIAGDISLSLGTVEVLTLKIRLLIASIDKAQEIGINWWQSDPALSSKAKELEEERDDLKQRLERLEAMVALRDGEPKMEQERSPERNGADREKKPARKRGRNRTA
ncbi:MAG: gas vesicle protein [Chloroflexota bacterium]